MKIAHLCSKCGALHADEHVQLWGTTAESSGYGSVPVCTLTVTDPRTNAGAVCRGQLIAQSVANDTDTINPTPL